jgi:putative hydrolase of the HAD superfamily
MERDKVRAVFFDAGYTLLCMDPPQETLFLHVCGDLGVAIDRDKVAGAVERANAMLAPRTPAHEPAPYSRKRVDAFWIDYHRVVLSGCAEDPAATGAADAVYRRFSALLGWRIYDDVRPLLGELRLRNIKLGIVSNWTGDLEDVLRRLDLHSSFDVILDSAHVGHEKPHPQIFAEALRRAGVTPGEAMHVGDSIEHDVDGALRSGLRPVLVDRADRHASFDRAPRVSNLMDLVALL